MFKYNFIANDYLQTQSLIEQLENELDKQKWQIHDEPEYVFILGGDGTFLKAVHMYSEKLEKIRFIPFKSGGIGYYTNHNLVSNLKELILSIENGTNKEFSYELLEARFNNQSKVALNEIKIINETNSLYTNILIDDIFLQEFHGTGLVFSTSTGSTGYMKATGGAIIYDNHLGIFEMNEVFPVSTNKYRTVNAPIIFSKNNVVKIEGETKKQEIIIDTINYKLETDNLEVKISDKNVRVITSNCDFSKISMLRDLFVIDREKIK